MNNLVASIIVLLPATLLLALFIRKYTRTEQRLMTLSFVGHIVATLAQIAITLGVYESGDMTTYMSEGSILARAFEINPNRFGAIWLDLLLQREPSETLPILGAGHGTGTMVAIAALLAFVFRFSLYASCFFVSMLACFGKFAIYRVFRDLVPPEHRVRALIAILLVPSAIFWSAGILKEAFVIAGVGPVWLGIHRVLRGKIFRGVLLVVVGLLPIAALKPYTLFALAVAGGAWVAVDRLHGRIGRTGPVRIRPLYIVIGVALVFIGVIALGRIFPIYSIENLGEDLARHQRLGVQAGGGSYYEMGDESAMSLQKQIAFAPLAIITALFRPFPFEARNALAFVASLEALVFTGLVVQMFARSGFRGVVRVIMSTPVLFAGGVFTIVFGMAVGLATTNFGSLSRYRMPLIPFYAAIVLVVGAPALKRRLARVATGVAPAAVPTTPMVRRTGPPKRSPAELALFKAKARANAAREASRLKTRKVDTSLG